MDQGQVSKLKVSQHLQMNDQNEVGGKQKPITSGILKHINISNLMIKAPQEPRSQIYKSRMKRMISAISNTIGEETDE